MICLETWRSHVHVRALILDLNGAGLCHHGTAFCVIHYQLLVQVVIC